MPQSNPTYLNCEPTANVGLKMSEKGAVSDLVSDIEKTKQWLYVLGFAHSAFGLLRRLGRRRIVNSTGRNSFVFIASRVLTINSTLTLLCFTENHGTRARK